MHSFILFTLFLALVLDFAYASHINHRRQKRMGRRVCPSSHSSKPNSTTNGNSTQISNIGTGPDNTNTRPSNSGCFPSLDFKMPSNPPSSLDGWWCNMNSEYAFLGFSYEVTACQSASELKTEFQDIRNRFKGRYVRLYGACDREGFYDDVINAAWDAGLGVHALIWFGFDNSNQWQTRRNNLFNSLKSNPKAKFVTRAVQFGSEPLFDGVLSPSDLAAQVTQAKNELSSLKIPVTVSDMAYGYQKNAGAKQVLEAIDLVDAHILPFFGASSTTGGAAWSFVESNVKWFVDNAKGKKIIFTENGWPSQVTSQLIPNSKLATGSISDEQGYFNMLDSHCEDLKAVEGGGIGWFAHLYSDSMELGYGVLDTAGNPKFTFAPRTSC